MLRFLLVISTLACCVYGFSAISGKKVAILQSKGGGHGEIGFALAKALLGSNEVTILQDPAAKKETQPFCQYDTDLIAKGVKVEDCDLSNADAVCGALKILAPRPSRAACCRRRRRRRHRRDERAYFFCFHAPRHEV